MKLRARLQRLEESAVLAGGCPACRARRGVTVKVVSKRNDDGTVPEPPGMPLPYSRCGEIPELVLHFVKVIVASPVATSDQAAGLRDGESLAEVIGGDPEWSLSRGTHAETMP